MMELKKNPKKDLNRNSTLYFVAGLTMVLALSYLALEWKIFYEDEAYKPTAMTIEKDIMEDPYVLNPPPPPPPKPIVTPPVIKVVDDELEVPETIIEAVEPDQDYEIAEVGEIEVAEIEEEVKVIWTTIEEVPVFPGCEKESDKRACFNTMMQKHIRKTFRYPIIAQEMGTEGKVFTQFTIEKDGTIGNILLRGPDKNLEKEAKRIIGKLPKMKPGKQRDQNVKVAFSIPITFQLN